MKLKTIGHRALKSTILAALLLGSVNAVHAAINITISEVAGDVLVEYSGSINTAGLTRDGSAVIVPTINPGEGAFVSDGGWAFATGDHYQGVTGPVSFGSLVNSTRTSTTGSPLVLDAGGGTLTVSEGYASNSSIIGSSVYAFTSLASMGINQGTYVWNWGSGETADSLTITAVPEPSTYAAIFGCIALGVAVMRRRKS